MKFTKLLILPTIMVFMPGFRDVREKWMRIGTVKTIRYKNYITRVIDLHRVGPQYLTILEIRPRFNNEFKTFVQRYHAPSYIFPARLDRSFRVMLTGAGSPGPPEVYNPVAPNQHRILYAMTFPRLYIRDLASETCPILWGDTLRLICLNHYLERTSTYKNPMQATGYSIINGQIWIHGLYQGRLLHRFDFESGTLVDSLLDIKDLEKILHEKKILEKGELLAKKQEPKRHPVTKRKVYKSELQARILERQATPTSFPFRLLIKKKYVYLVIYQPFSILVLTWPDLNVISAHKITKEDLPAWTHRYQEFSLEGLVAVHGTAGAWIGFQRGITYGELRRSNPLAAEIHATGWKKTHPNESLAPDTILLLQTDLLLFKIGPKGIQEILDPYSAFRDQREWAPLGPPFILDEKEIWMPVRSTTPDRSLARYGIAQIVY